ncbi:peroxidase family protein [Bosea vaviloviae]|uniref:Rhodanese domain-containing protein n=1 Tax=Bosea vaviloviae TaxID=1526658 RepID=A0A1D7U489_9HYPH|nr:peroxidase family protein [Bosea vaviloviae]AOO82189.1 hypothetical protein BHK69_18645 [Bosea vaviloviae]
MVTYIRSDLDFILAQIKIAEAHAAGQPLFGPGGLVPAYTLSYGLRTVDGRDNNLLPNQEAWGAADIQFPALAPPEYRSAEPSPFGPPGPATNYNPSNAPGSMVFDSSLRTISNLLVDQTLANPAAVLTALERAGSADPMADLALVTPIYTAFKPAFDAEYQARVVMQGAVAAFNDDPLNPTLIAARDAAVAAHDVTVANLLAARDVRDLALEPFGIAMDGDNVHLPNIAPDEGLSAPFNSWFTLFGQFFDHGLDLVNKGGSGTVFIPLQPDDPLYVVGSPTNFMVLTRATVSAGTDGIMGTPDDVGPVNTTTSFVDQNQTYTSHSSHQVFLRQYVLNAAGDPVATGKLIEGGGLAPGGMATWGEVKAQSAAMLGIKLTDFDVGNVPLLRTDQYGNFIPDANGMPQLITGIGADGIPNTADDIVVSGNLATPVDPTVVGALRIGHAFLADIAHEAVPVGKIADGDITIGLANPGNGDTEYDNELLDAHFIAGDGRVNENIGLTAVHHIFHSEHNRLVDHTKEKILASNDLAFINEWLAVDVAAVPTTPAELAALNWDGERIFQAAKFGTEMQYQHLVFEDFARKIQPAIDFFVVPDGYHADINPSIVAEFAHVVYRFGHSMLTETVDRLDSGFNSDPIGLIEAFLNPIEFDANHTIADGVAAGDIIRGMTRQVGNEIDEFVTTALRNNLLGLPLDLATINLARGRDTGVPSLNSARETFYEASSHAPELKPYASWVDFAGNLKHEASIINFIAAYGTHTLITSQTTLEGRRDAALTIITGVSADGVMAVPADRVAFLNGYDAYAGGALGGLNNVDLWIGGLAEKIMPFGGMLGSTFNFVFEVQMEKLQDGDRFYYLQRLDGLHLLAEMENNTFAKLILKNADAGHLPSDVFSTPGLILEVDRTKQFNPGLGETAGADGILVDDPLTAADESADNLGNDPVGMGLLSQLVIRDNPATPVVDTNYLKYTGDEHVLLGGTDGNDILTASIGDDTLYGDAGNDRMEGGYGNDQYIGGEGDDIITDIGGDDIIRSGPGNDAINAGLGTDLVVAEEGQDFVVLGADMLDEVFGGVGDDFILGSKTTEQSMGGEGNDWIEVGAWTGAIGDNFDDQFAADMVIGHDVFHGDGGFDEFIGEGGDDIWVGSIGRGKFDGMSGFDWATYSDMLLGVNADLFRQHFDALPLPPPDAALDEYSFVEGVSGSKFNDQILGSDVTAADMPTEGARGSVLNAEGIALINGLQAIVGAGVTSFAGGNILLGGDGSDTITGRGGDDIIDGDKWLDVEIGVFALADVNHTGTPLALHRTMKTLTADVFAGLINPGQLSIVRTIKTDATPGDIDVAKYQGLRSDYSYGATADGQVTITDTTDLNLDGSDRLRSIERVQFSDNSSLGIIVGTPGNDTLNGTATDDLILGLAGADTLNGLAGNDILVGGPGGNTATYLDNFNNPGLGNSNGTASWDPDWVESGDSGGTTSGQIRIDNGNDVLQFIGGIPAGSFDGAQIQRTVDLAGATAATLTYSIAETGLDASDDSITVFFSRDGTTFVQVDLINDATNTVALRTIDLTLFGTGPFTANAAIRFVASSLEAGDSVNIDNLTFNFTNPALNTGVDTLNGGLGDDTYVFNPGDGTDIINEAVNATSGGTADRISIVSVTTDPLIGPVLTGLNAHDDNTGTNNGSLVITANGGTITVAGHFTGTTAGTGVERIGFNNATFAGYLLGADDYLVSRLDPNNRDAGGVNLSTSLVNNFVVGEQGVNDIIAGGAGNDLIFGGTGDNDLIGGDGDDLLVGGSGTGDDDLLDGGLGADTMIGLAGNDDYVVDDLLDVVVEAAAAGTDEVLTEMAALSIELMANVENLTYTGVDADPFVGTGNSLNNVISGGDLNDTLSGLGGNDTLNGGLGADTMIGGDGNDVYEVDEAGDVVTETNADLLIGGTDRVESDIDYALGANVENLDLNGTAITGTGNALNNVINGNDENNQLFGAGGNDTLNGGDGSDVIDGGLGNDAIAGGNDNDTIIGNAGDDTIDVGGGFNRLVYNAVGFGADTINSFDADGGLATNQDKIDLSALGVTAANFAARVVETAVAGPAGRLLTINDGAANVLGTIRINNVTDAQIDINDFTLAVAAPPAFGTPTAGADTITGNAAANSINGLGGNDTLSGAGGDDVITGGEGADTLNAGDGNDTLSGGAGSNTGTYADNFNVQSYSNSTGTVTLAGSWSETGVGETPTSPTAGDIEINGNRLRFDENTDGGETIQRSINLAGATSATLSFAYEDDNLGAGQNVVVEAWNVVASTWNILGTLGSTTGNGNGTFTATLTVNQIGAASAIRFRAEGDGNNWDGGDNFYIDNFAVSFTVPGLNAGVDTVNGDAGDDTIIWNANGVAPTDGRDIVNGGTEGAAGDTFVINGNAAVETYRIYAMTGGQNATLATTLGTTFAAATEIVVTRTVGATTTVVAELSEIEEIRINGADPSGIGTSGGDTFEVIGDFSGTSLRPNTITIDGDAGDDTIDISALSSAHRIVFRSNGGNDTIVGTLRPQDVIELPDGAVPEDYTSTTDENGVTTMTNGTHSISFTAPDGPPQVGDGDDEDEHQDDDDTTGNGDDADDDYGCGDDDDDETGTPAPSPSGSGSTRVGTASGDTLLGTGGADNIIGLAGDDVLIGDAGDDAISAGDGADFVDAGAGRDTVHGGSGDDHVFAGADTDLVNGEAGADRLFGQGGNDVINAGAGDDAAFGGAGNDLFVGEVGDGNDTYYGDEIDGGNGVDTLDLSAISANLTVDLGNGMLGRGSAVSSQSGSDTLWHIENVATGSGNDTITAGRAVNVMEGGAGDDVFRFSDTESADGDTILDFQPGDRLDLSSMDADGAVAGNQNFTLVNGPAFSAAAQLMVSNEERDGVAYTIVSGNVSGDAAEEFRIELKGSHNLTANNFVL